MSLNGTADDHTERVSLVRVFRTRSGVVEGPRQPAHHGGPMLSSASPRQPIRDFYTRLRQYEHFSGWCRQGPELSSRTTTVRLNALDRIGRLEHEGARHRRERKVKRDVDENCEE